MRASQTRRVPPPVILTVQGTKIGGAENVEKDAEGTFFFEDLDSSARVFFAERLGPGGPGEDAVVADVTVEDTLHHQTLHASRAIVRHFSSGTGELALSAQFAREGKA